MEGYIRMNKLKKTMHKISLFIGNNNISINVNKTSYGKNCLICYIRSPFENGLDSSHQNEVQVIEIAKIFGEFNYNVDVIDYRSTKVKLRNHYDVVFDICVRTPAVYKNNIDHNTKRIVYFTGSESDFANSAEMQRIREVKERRNVDLIPRRQAPKIDPDVENFDMALMIGNAYTFSTYSGFKFKKKALIPNTGYEFNFTFDKKQKKSTSFLFFGSAGAVHKGLDLLLEVFAELGNPYKLYVCGGYDSELDFIKEYDHELNHTDNIFPVGFVDIWSEKFRKLSSECSFTVLPSCSEGCAGTITTCMSAGVVPICSRNCGYEEEEVITLKDCNKETIKQTVIEAANMSLDEIEEKSKEAVQLTKSKYSMENFRKVMRNVLGEVLNV